MVQRVACLVIAFALAGGSAFADDLAALAKKEKERRAKVATPGKVLTEEDAKSGAAGSVTALAGPPPAAATPPPPGGSPDEQKAIWKARAEAIRTEIWRGQIKLDGMEIEYEEYRSGIGEIPAAELQDPLRLQKREAHLVELRAGLEVQRRLVADAKKSLSALEDGARKSGIPPGWLR